MPELMLSRETPKMLQTGHAWMPISRANQCCRTCGDSKADHPYVMVAYEELLDWEAKKAAIERRLSRLETELALLIKEDTQ